jgi:hypothetical protein
MVSVYHWLSDMSVETLNGKYAALRKARRSAAIKTGKINSDGETEETSSQHVPKEQMVEELMLEYLKGCPWEDGAPQNGMGACFYGRVMPVFRRFLCLLCGVCHELNHATEVLSEKHIP